jgi:hypothetical protein
MPRFFLKLPCLPGLPACLPTVVQWIDRSVFWLCEHLVQLRGRRKIQMKETMTIGMKL